MRIAIINSVRVCGGGEKWAVRQACCWRERGHQPLVICDPGSGLETIARQARLPVAPVPMPNDISLVSVGRLVGALRRFEAALVLCCNERAFRLAAPAARLAGRPPLVYRNGLTATFKDRTLNRLLFRWAARMVLISQPLHDEMTGFGWLSAEKLRIIRNGLDASLYDPDPAARARVRAELGCASDAVVAAVLARVTEDKGQLETIEALAALAPAYPQAELWIVGEGSLRPRLEALARERGVGERVRFPGFRTDVPAVLQAVDIVVQASHREGLGNTLLEAMAAARPIVASAVGGILDVVLPGETGLLVPPRDPVALAAALEPLLAAAALRQRYGAAGRRRVETEFPLRGETDKWCALFDELVGERQSSGVKRRSSTGSVGSVGSVESVGPVGPVGPVRLTTDD